jgi:hypothetical protein
MLNVLGQAAPKVAGSSSQCDKEFSLGLIKSHQRLARNVTCDCLLGVPKNASERKRERDYGKHAADHQNNQHRSAQEALAGFNGFRTMLSVAGGRHNEPE